MKTLKDFLLEEVSAKRLSPEQALLYFEELKLKRTHSEPSQDLAVIGIACRLPQANTPEQYWNNLVQGKDCVIAFPKNRIRDIKYANQKAFDQYQGLNCRVGAYFDRVDLFDHSFFGITPTEARSIDPAQRLFLETAFEALEDAALTEATLKGSKTGIYIGYSVSEDNYIDILDKNDSSTSIGNQPAMMAYRLAYMFDLKGPTMLIDTACSASLVALHQACQAILAGDCDQAIIGGVNIRFFPAIREIANLGIEAYDGRCKTFDEKANGTNIGDGIAAIIVKRRDLAERDKDFIYALIKGSAVNSDGASNGMTAPTPQAQTDVIVEAWKRANISPESLSFIEAHGTGTKLGDPIEVSALSQAFRLYTDRKQYVPLGAVKTNIGHLEAAAGLAGFIKVILSLKHRRLPPNIHFQKPNPFIDFENSPVYPNTQLLDLSNQHQPLLAGISSFGISGTNCHMVVEEYVTKRELIENTEFFPLFLSAKDRESLINLIQKYVPYLEKAEKGALPHISFTSLQGRNHYSHRLVTVGSSCQEIADKLKTYLDSNELTDSVFYNNLKENKGWDVPNSWGQSFNSSIIHLTTLYLNGQVANWKTFFHHDQVGKVPLPTYAFNAHRHWPKLELEVLEDSNARFNSLFYELKWIPEEKVNANFSKANEGLFLFFLRDHAEHHALFDFFSYKGIQGIKIYPSTEFAKKDHDTFYIDPKNFQHYVQLLKAVPDTRIGGVVHLWDCLSSSVSMDSYEAISHSQDLGTFSCFHFINACQLSPIEKEFKFVTLTTFAQKVDGEEPWLDPSRMPSLGLNKVISQEFPKVQSLAIDINLDYFNQTVANDLYLEICEPLSFKDSVVAFRKGKRFIQVLDTAKIDLPPAKFSIRENGVYLIVGGAGYLGLETALLLAQKKPVKLALIGRKGADELSKKQKNLIEQIKKSGSEVLYMAGDVSDKEQCMNLISFINEKWGAINGIFVAIKNISHQQIDQVPFEEFSRNILTKLKAVWLLDALNTGQFLDFIATFSSISSLTGGPTGADCCASNLFLDSFSDYRNARGDTTINMNYTLIEADDGSLLSDRLSMIPPITKEEFLRALDIFLTKDLPFAVVADFDSQMMSLVLPFMKIRFSEKLIERFTRGSKIEKHPMEESKPAKKFIINDSLPPEEVRSELLDIWKEVLGYEEIKDNDNFFTLGGDSISSIKLTHLVKNRLQIEMEVSDLYSHPTFKDYYDCCMSGLKEDNINPLSQLLIDIDKGLIDPSEAANLIK